MKDLKEVLIRDKAGSKAAEDATDRFIETLKEGQFIAYFDEPKQVVAIVFPGTDGNVTQLGALSMNKAGWLTNVADVSSFLS